MEGESMSEWKEVRLGDVCNLYSGGTPNKNNKTYWNGNIPWISAKSMYGDYIEDADLYITEEGLSNGSRLAPKGSILILTRGSGLYNRIPICYTLKDVAFNQDVKRIESKDEDLYPNDLLYYILYANKKTISSIIESTGIGAGKIDTDRFLNLPITIPPVYIQKDLIELFNAIFSKIETNNKLNEKLEEMAQAIFKSWFVDFEPFKDKPFHETELGMIPEGWEVSTFSSIIEKLISGDWGKETPTGNYVHKVACIRGCDFENIKNGLRGKTPERFILERNFASKQPKPNDIVVEMSGGTATVSTGRICYITKELLDQYEGDIVCTNFCKIVRPLKGWSQYLYYYWQYKYDKKVMFCYENGTSGIKNFAINDFIDFESILIPPKDELIKFNSIIDNIRVKIQMNGVENTRLASLRDTLLPRLMSGELIV